MGVKNLWRLLLPVGHRVSIETLAHKTLAIDASIWLAQISKACRDPETGRLLPNRPHVRIFLVRLMRLLYHRIKPVVVFDGATPEVKRREIQRRKDRREKLWRDGDDGEEGSGGALKRMAKKILVQQLKERREREAGARRQKRSGDRGKHVAAASKHEAAEDRRHSNDGAFATGFTLPKEDGDGTVSIHSPDGKHVKAKGKDASCARNDKEMDVISIHSEEEDRGEQIPSEQWTGPQREDEGSRDSEDDWEMSRPVQTSINDSLRPPNRPPQRQSPTPHDTNHAALAALPALSRSKWIDDQHSSQRIRARRECLQVAADPRAFSDTQLRNVLRSRRLKRRVEEIEREAAAVGDAGRGRETRGEAPAPGCQRSKRRRQERSDGEKDGDMFTSGGAAERGRVSMREIPGGDDLGNDSEVGGGFLPANLISTPTETDTKGGVLLDDHNSDCDSGIDDNGSQRNKANSAVPTRSPLFSNTSTKNATDAPGTMFDSSALLELSMAEQQWEEWDGVASDNEEENASTSRPEAARSNTALPPMPLQVQRDEKATAVAQPGEVPSECDSDSDSDSNGQGGSFLNCVAKTVPPENSTTKVERKKDAAAGNGSDDDDEEEDDDDDDDGVDWEDGSHDDDDVDWEDGRDGEHFSRDETDTLNSSICTKKVPCFDEHKKASNLEHITPDDNDITTSERRGEQKFASAGREDAVQREPPEPNPSCDHNSSSGESSDGHKNNCFDSFPPENLDTVALQHAQETASRLTSWAGRAFQRAISSHVGQHQTEAGSSSHTNEIVASDLVDDGAGDSVDAKNIGETKPSGSDLGNCASSSPRISSPPSKVDTLDTSLEGLTRLHNAILSEEKAIERDMSTITDDMKEDILALLRLCGIPWVESPSEAEAQCAALEGLGLVDGVVTEDSDVFVFGGKKVYKNFFNEMHYVEAYFAKDIERELALKRPQLVALAMLLGGDYTAGVKGVGIVNGMEVLQAFPIEDSSDGIAQGLNALRDWLDGFDVPSSTDSNGKDTSSSSNKVNCSNIAFCKKHSSARTRWIAPADFPSRAIINAYLKPVVDNSTVQFSWGKPDQPGLQRFLAESLGWEQGETDRILNPVLKLESSSKQTRIESYFMKYDDGIKFAAVRSKRLKAVLKDIQFGNAMDSESDDEQGMITKSTKPK